MPKCSMPPGTGPASWISTWWPRRVEMVGGRQPAGTRADHQDALATARRVDRGQPAFARRHIAEEPFHRMDADGRIQLVSIAAGLARVVADAAMHRGQRIVAHQCFPGLAVFACLRQSEPGLDVFARRAGVVAGRQEIDIDRPTRADRPSAWFAGQVCDGCHISRLQRHGLSLCLSSGRGSDLG